jgi:membrane-associated phospholipid phosphatase
MIDKLVLADKKATLVISGMRLGLFTALAIAFSSEISLVIACMITFVALILFDQVSMLTLFIFFALLVFLEAAVWILKFLVRRPRPSEVLGIKPKLITHDLDYSFPSGVAAGLAYVSIVLAASFPNAGPYVIGAAFLLSLLRTYAGVHFVSDVIAGFAIGAMAGTASAILFPVPV